MTGKLTQAHQSQENITRYNVTLASFQEKMMENVPHKTSVELNILQLLETFLKKICFKERAEF